jgi:hypothetical protein
LFPLFATSAIDAGGKFTAGVVDTCGNLPPVSMTQAVPVAKFTASVIDNCGKFASGVPSNLLILPHFWTKTLFFAKLP